MLGEMIDAHPMVWILEMDGILFDARNAPLDIQVEAYQKGLIPYVPGVDMEKLDALIRVYPATTCRGFRS